MNNKVTNITFAGLGGQGVLKATDILAEVLFLSGYDVKKSEVHGMSQRGGSVSSEVRFGVKVASPMIPDGEADFLAVIDETQIDVNRDKLKSNGVLITPSDIAVEKLGNKKAINIAMLGALSKSLTISDELWFEIIKKHLPAKLHEMNIEAFKIGRGE